MANNEGSPGWLDEVVASFRRLGGEGNLTNDIYPDIEAHTQRRLTREWQAIVRRTIEEHSSDTKTKTKRPNYADLFESISGIGKGRWALRDSARRALSPLQSLEVVRDRAEVVAAENSMQEAFKSAALPKRIIVGVPGESIPRTVYWNPVEGIWATFRRDPTKYWNGFGMTDSATTSNAIDCEINPSLTGSTAPSGAFLRHSASGELYLAHRGTLGGTFLGKSHLFWGFYDGPFAIVDRGSYAEKYAIVSALDDPELAPNIAHFVRLFKDVKAQIKAGIVPPLKDSDRKNFSEEYAGRRRYQRGGYVESTNAHALVTNALAATLRDDYRLKVRNTRRKDVEVLDHHGNPITLFEVKSDCDSQSLYTAVGQLFLNGRAKHPKAKLAAVLPSASKETTRLLAAIEIETVLAHLQDDETVVFDGLEKVV